MSSIMSGMMKWFLLPILVIGVLMFISFVISNKDILSLSINDKIKNSNDGQNKRIVFAKNKKLNFKMALIVILLFVFITLIKNTFNTVNTGEIGIKTTFGKIENNILYPGLHIKFPFQKINVFDTREIKKVIETMVFSKDIQEVKVNIAVKYKIKLDKAITIYNDQGIEYYEKTIEPAVLGSLKSSINSYDAENIIANREKLTQAIFNYLHNVLDKNNIILLEITLQDIDFSDAFTNAVEAKQVATQEKLKAEQEAEKKKIDADGNAYVKIKEAEAEAKANEMKQKSISDNLIRYEAIQKWNGQLPQVEGSSTPIISLK